MHETESTGSTADEGRQVAEHPVAAQPVDAPIAVPGVDPEDERAVPEAFAAMVDAARHAHRTMAVNPIYLAQDAVGAVEDVLAVLHHIAQHIAGYTSDYSKPAGRRVDRSVELLASARSELGVARGDLRLEESREVPAEPVPV